MHDDVDLERAEDQRLCRSRGDQRPAAADRAPITRNPASASATIVAGFDLGFLLHPRRLDAHHEERRDCEHRRVDSRTRRRPTSRASRKPGERRPDEDRQGSRSCSRRRSRRSTALGRLRERRRERRLGGSERRRRNRRGDGERVHRRPGGASRKTQTAAAPMSTIRTRLEPRRMQLAPVAVGEHARERRDDRRRERAEARRRARPRRLPPTSYAYTETAIVYAQWPMMANAHASSRRRRSGFAKTSAEGGSPTSRRPRGQAAHARQASHPCLAKEKWTREDFRPHARLGVRTARRAPTGREQRNGGRGDSPKRGARGRGARATDRRASR